MDNGKFPIFSMGNIELQTTKQNTINKKHSLAHGKYKCSQCVKYEFTEKEIQGSKQQAGTESAKSEKLPFSYLENRLMRVKSQYPSSKNTTPLIL